MGKIKKEGIIIFSKIRKRIKRIKEDLYSAKVERLTSVWKVINYLCIFVIATFVYFIGTLFFLLNSNAICIVILIADIIYLILATNNAKVHSLTIKISFRIVQFLLRYGKVVTKKDWKNIKNNVDNYKILITDKSIGYCYYYSRLIALFLEDAQLMYCSVKDGDGLSAHAVIVKNNCVYDTNDRKHYNYEEYIERECATVYKFFSADEYRKESFFDDIRDGFAEWCTKNDVYCDPE